MSRAIAIILLLALFSGVLSACIPGRTKSVLSYSGPTEITVKAGEFVPGTPIQYMGQEEKGARFLIEGQEAIKLVGDSLKWSGNVTPDVFLSVNLRILHISPQQVITSGLVTIGLDNVTPQKGGADENRPVRYTLPVTYKVDKNGRIPGTTVKFVGVDKEKGAQLEGVEGYPYRAIGDSILWDGHLLSNVDLQLNVRVLFYNDSFLQVLGTATVGISP